MKKKFKYIGSSIFITLSFVFGIGIISSIGMIVIKNSLEHVALISGIAQAMYLLIVILIFKIKKMNIQQN